MGNRSVTVLWIASGILFVAWSVQFIAWRLQYEALQICLGL